MVLRLELCVLLVALPRRWWLRICCLCNTPTSTCFRILGHSLTFFPMRLVFLGNFIRNEGAHCVQMMVGIVGNLRTVCVRLQLKEEM